MSLFYHQNLSSCDNFNFINFPCFPTVSAVAKSQLVCTIIIFLMLLIICTANKYKGLSQSGIAVITFVTVITFEEEDDCVYS